MKVITRRQLRKLINETMRSPLGHGFSDPGARSDYYYGTYRKQIGFDDKMQNSDYRAGYEHGMEVISQFADDTRGEILDVELTNYLEENPLPENEEYHNGFNEAYREIEHQIFGQYEL